MPDPVLPDPALLDRIYAEEGISVSDRTGLGDLVGGLVEWLLYRLPDWFPEVDVPPGLVTDVAIALILVAVAVLAIRALRRWWEGRPRERVAFPTAALPPDVDPRAELEAALARGDARAALAALWRLVARGLDRRGIGVWGADRTTREFVESARETSPGWSGLPELAVLGTRVDRLAYGPGEPALDDVRAMALEAERVIG